MKKNLLRDEENIPVELIPGDFELQPLTNSQTETVMKDVLSDKDGIDDIIKQIDTRVNTVPSASVNAGS